MRILFLTLYYPPLNMIAAHRVKAFVDTFQSRGVQCDVITRYYDKDQQKGINMFIGSQAALGMNQPYYKEENIIYTNFDFENDVMITSMKMPSKLRGIYNYKKIDVFHYGWLKFVFSAFENELKDNTYDFIVPSYGPPITLLAAKKLSEKYNIPVIADFRDAYIDKKTNKGHLFFKKLVQHFLLKNTVGLSFASQGMLDYFFVHSKLRNIPSKVIYNGTLASGEDAYSKVDERIVNSFIDLKGKNDLLLLFPGTLAEGQNIDFFVDTLKKINSEGKLKVGLLFLGWAENNFKTKFENEFIAYLPRVSYQTSKFLQKKASALIWPVMAGSYTGLSGKIFEYLASDNFVLLSPNPYQDLNYFLEKSENIYTLNTQNELEQILMDIFTCKVKIKPLVNKEILKRDYWAEQLLQFIRVIKDEKSGS